MGERVLFFLSAFLIGSLAGPASEPIKEPVVSDKTATIYWKLAEEGDEFYPESVLLLGNEGENISISGHVTEDNSYTFDDLEPNKPYIVKIFGLSSDGVNEKKFQEVKFTTVAEGAAAAPVQQAIPPPAPSRVENLEVYQLSDTEIRVKWNKPAQTNGELRGFRIFWSSPTGMTYTDRGALPCVDLKGSDVYCFTVSRLRPSTKYTISVQARNYWSRSYSDMASVWTETKAEPDSDTPTNLVIENLTPSSFDLKWSYPERPKVAPQSYLIKVNEEDRFDKDNCCQKVPDLEIPYKSGETSFKTQVVGLNPAAKYTVNVYGKRKGVGAPATVTVHTRPPRLGLVGETLMVQVPVGNFRFIHQRNATNETLYKLYSPMISGPKVLLALSTEEVTKENSGIKEENVYNLIKSTFDSSFFAIVDLDKDVKSNLKLGTEGSYKGKWGENKWQFKNGTACYRLVAIQVSKYLNTYGLDWQSNGEPFQPKTLLSPFTFGYPNTTCY